MEEKILNNLSDLGYSGPLLDKINLENALKEGSKSVEYTKLINFLVNELRTLLNLDEEVNAIDSPEDSVSFIMEVGSFLKELNCPYSSLFRGHVSDRLQTIPDKSLLIDYLCTELMAARILRAKKPAERIELKLHETEEAANLRRILTTLRFPKPPANITAAALFQKVTPVLQAAVQKAGPDLVGNSAFSTNLTDRQWETLSNVQKDLSAEYRIRREMLLTRLDVTIQSFQWSDRTQGKDDTFERVYNEKRKKLKADPDVDLSSLIAARDEIAIIEKTSSSSVRKNTKSSLNKVIIGQVPDRGGRTSEQVPPPPDMPFWQQRTAGPSSGRGRGRGGGNFSRGGDFRNSGKQQNQNKGNDVRPSYNNSGGFDSAGSYGAQNTYNNQRSSFDSAGSYGGQNAYNNQKSSFDSAGSYGNNSRDYSYEQDSKRPKTYDSYQTNRTNYADQYAQEEQHNRQYHNRGRGGGGRGGSRGRSNYNRGGGGGSQQNYYGNY